MSRLLLILLLVQLSPAQTSAGAVSGIVLSPNGMPAAGIRVYAIPAGDPNALFNSGTMFESLAQTDNSGRYRLEAPAGRYYIAAGSVNSPTYYPDVASVASARVVLVTAGAVTDGVNFSRYVPATASPLGNLYAPALPPGSTGVLSGVIRSADGNPAPDVPVVLVPLSTVQALAAAVPPVRSSATGSVVSGTIQLSQGQPCLQTGVAVSSALLAVLSPAGGSLCAITDNFGRYRLNSVSPNSYKIMAGYAESPIFFPSTADVSMATSITTTPATMRDNLDLILPPAPRTTSLRGRISAKIDRPAGGAGVTLRSMDSPVGLAGLLPRRIYNEVLTGADGSYEIPNVVPGSYSVQARLAGATAISKNIVMTDQPGELNFEFAINVVFGRIFWEDGTPFSDNGLNEVAVSTISNPNLIATTIFTVVNGTFSHTVEAGDYRFFVRSLPDEFTVTSMKSGTTDLLKEPLAISGDDPVDIEVRVAKKGNAGVTVSGVVRDASTARPAAAEHVQLCCLDTGPYERLSTVLQADGSFEFHGVIPHRRYSAELRGKTMPALANPVIEVGSESTSGLILASATRFVSINVDFLFKNVSVSTSAVSLALKSTAAAGQVEGLQFTMLFGSSGTPWTPVPAGLRYDVSVINLPAGCKVESLSSGAIDLLANPLNIGPASPLTIRVVIAPKD